MQKISQEIIVIPAKPEDILGMQKVFYDTWLATYPNREHGITKEDLEESFKDAFTDETIQKRAEQLEQLPENIKMFVAKDGLKIIGVCRVTLRENCNQLQAIYVLPEYQGRGIGKMFWKEAQKVFDPKRKTIVETATYNTNAIRFYKNWVLKIPESASRRNGFE
ncbi:MAG TPA: GNAT family N-acetyltransferase [Candidatus Paceibacterota bacterium]|nr:GNAT family N-acetyltransferase [Candidatus Paceibacterota bacterium]